MNNKEENLTPNISLLSPHYSKVEEIEPSLLVNFKPVTTETPEEKQIYVHRFTIDDYPEYKKELENKIEIQPPYFYYNVTVAGERFKSYDEIEKEAKNNSEIMKKLKKTQEENQKLKQEMKVLGDKIPEEKVKVSGKVDVNKEMFYKRKLKEIEKEKKRIAEKKMIEEKLKKKRLKESLEAEKRQIMKQVYKIYLDNLRKEKIRKRLQKEREERERQERIKALQEKIEKEKNRVLPELPLNTFRHYKLDKIDDVNLSQLYNFTKVTNLENYAKKYKTELYNRVENFYDFGSVNHIKTRLGLTLSKEYLVNGSLAPVLGTMYLAKRNLIEGNFGSAFLNRSVKEGFSSWGAE